MDSCSPPLSRKRSILASFFQLLPDLPVRLSVPINSCCNISQLPEDASRFLTGTLHLSESTATPTQAVNTPGLKPTLDRYWTTFLAAVAYNTVPNCLSGYLVQSNYADPWATNSLYLSDIGCPEERLVSKFRETLVRLGPLSAGNALIKEKEESETGKVVVAASLPWKDEIVASAKQCPGVITRPNDVDQQAATSSSSKGRSATSTNSNGKTRNSVSTFEQRSQSTTGSVRQGLHAPRLTAADRDRRHDNELVWICLIGAGNKEWADHAACFRTCFKNMHRMVGVSSLYTMLLVLYANIMDSTCMSTGISILILHPTMANVF